MRNKWASALLVGAFLFSFQQTAPYLVFLAEVCRGPAAYPPDLPDCLDPAVLAAQEAAKKVAEEKAAAEVAKAAAEAKAAEEKAKADAARILAEQEKAKADAIAAEIAAGNIKAAAEKAAAEAKAAADAASRVEAAKVAASGGVRCSANGLTATFYCSRALSLRRSAMRAKPTGWPDCPG